MTEADDQQQAERERRRESAPLEKLQLSQRTFAALYAMNVATVRQARRVGALGKGGVAELQKALRRYDEEQRAGK